MLFINEFDFINLVLATILVLASSLKHFINCWPMMSITIDMHILITCEVMDEFLFEVHLFLSLCGYGLNAQELSICQ